jgi:hypothetical protein
MSNAFALDFDLLKGLLTPTLSSKTKKHLRLSLSEVGTLKAPSKKLTVIDPGWMFPDKISRLVKSPPSDAAIVRLATITSGLNEGLPAFINLQYGNLEKAVGVEIAQLTQIALGCEQGRISVDSGEISIIDAAQIPPGDQAQTLAFGESILKHASPSKALVIDPVKAAFLVAKSGNGDGAYPCYWLKDAQGEILALLIDFENWTPSQNPQPKGNADGERK